MSFSRDGGLSSRIKKTTMATDAIGFLSTLLKHCGREIDAAEFACVGHLAPLITSGLLVPVGFPKAIPCEVCGEAHTVDVVSIEGRPQGVCRRTGETFTVSPACALYRVDGDAFARSIAKTLELEGDTRLLRGFSAVWRLGARRLDDTLVAFFFTPALDRLDMASTILEAVAQQTRAMRCVLLVASDIDAVRLLRHRDVVVSLRDVITGDVDGRLSVDEDELIIKIFPQAAKRRPPGRPTRQRDLILPLLDELDAEGVAVDGSNATCSAVRERFKDRYPKAKVPVINTVKSAVAVWRPGRNEQTSAR